MTRDAVLRVVFPAMLVGFVYFVAAPRFLGRLGERINPTRAAERTRGQVEVARDKAPSSSQLLRDAADVGALADAVGKVRAEKDALDARWAAFTASRSTGAKRTELLSRIEGVLTANNLTPIEQGLAGVDGRAPVPASLRPVLDLAGSADSGGRTFRFRFRGRYAEVSAALDELAGKKWDVFPVGLTMDEADYDQPVRAWTLLVWV